MIDRKTEPKIRPINDIHIPSPEIMELKNGIKLFVINAGSEDVIRFDVIIGGGQWVQEIPLQATFTNRILREGTNELTSSQIAEKLDYYGSWLDLSSSTNCNFATLYSLGKYFSKTLDVLGQMIKQPSFPEKEFSIIVENNKQQFIVNSSKVDYMARRRLSESLFGTNHPLGRFANYDDYDNIKIDDLKRYYLNNYSYKNCKLFVSGKVTKDIIKEIEIIFGNDKWGDIDHISIITDVTPQITQNRKQFIHKEGALQSSLKMGSFMMDRSHPDFFKARVMTTLFGGYFGSRLMSNIREDKGYTYGINAGIVSYPKYGVLAISTEAANEYISNIIKEIHIEMDKLKNELVGDDELRMVKSYMIGDLCRSYEGPFSIAEAWIYTEIYQLNHNFYNDSLRNIKEVTKEEIRMLAGKYLCKKELIEVVAGEKM